MVTLYLKSLCVMHFQSSFNALIMPRKAPYNALYISLIIATTVNTL